MTDPQRRPGIGSVPSVPYAVGQIGKGSEETGIIQMDDRERCRLKRANFHMFCDFWREPINGSFKELGMAYLLVGGSEKVAVHFAAMLGAVTEGFRGECSNTSESKACSDEGKEWTDRWRCVSKGFEKRAMMVKVDDRWVAER